MKERELKNLIKQLSSDDPISARFLYKESFEFKPQFKLFISTNHRPELTSDDPAIWRRVVLIPFEVMIPPDKRDKDLAQKLKGESPGILVWAVQGCLEWRKNGFNRPEIVENATNQYRDNMDVVKRFINECCEVDNVGTLSTNAINSAFEQWRCPASALMEQTRVIA